MIDITRDSFSEAYDVIMHMEKKLYEKIPKSFINLICENMNKEYKPNIDYSKNINTQNISKGAKGILALVYRDFICSKEKKQELIKKDQLEIQKIEEEKARKYNVDDLFKTKNPNQYQNNVPVKVETKKQNIFTRFFEFIKRLFNR